MLETTLVLLASLAVIAKSAHLVIENAITLARFFKISDLAIGFILIAVATSLPEFVISVVSAPMGEGALSVGNVIGANIINILVILGIGALLMGGIAIRSEERVELVRILFAISAISLILIMHREFWRLEGAVLLVIFAAYVYHLLLRKRIGLVKSATVPRGNALRAFILFSVGIGLLLVSAGFAVQSATKLADIAGLTKSFIGATLISLGTTLPELSISIVALKRRNPQLAIGNAVGSCMVNLTLVLGTVGFLSSVKLSVAMLTTLMAFMLGANLLLLYLIKTRKELGRFEGALFLLFYMLFLISASGMELELSL